MQTDLSFSQIAMFGALVAFTVILTIGALFLAWRAASSGLGARLRSLRVERDTSSGHLAMELKLGPAKQGEGWRRFWEWMDPPKPPQEPTPGE